ncbi:MAG: MATE family efflux transporter [Bacteroidetes bacterium]|nr:MATE family efflux transporter [Bacteroidota bacterium]
MKTPGLLSRIYALIAQSLRGDEHDYTQGSLPKAVFLLAIPMILELSLESVFAVVDMFFVGKLGENAIATVGLTESVITIIYSIAIGLSTAATAIVARRTGEKDTEGANLAGAQTLLVAFVLILISSAAGFIWAGDILGLMGASDAVIESGAIFTRIMLSGSAPIFLLFLINGIFRGAGNAAIAMKSLWLASIINIVLCPLFINIWGLKGAAIATVIGRSCGVLYQCYFLFYGKGSIHLKISHFRTHWESIRSIVNVAWPATLQFIIASGSWIFIARLVATSGGTTASAGYQIAIRSIVFFILPAWGLSNAAATLVGQNLGAGNIDRAYKSAMLTAKYNAVFMGFVMLLFLFFSPQIMGIFTQDEAIRSFGITTLQIIGSAYVFYGIGMVMSQALNGAGDTRTPTLINIICFWCVQVPMAWVLTHPAGLGKTGAVIAIPIAETLLALLAWYFFYRGKWKTVKV